MNILSSSDWVNNQGEWLDNGDFANLTLLVEHKHSILYKVTRGGQQWILKALPADERDNPLEVQRLEKEYAILARLSHPGIVKAMALTHVEGVGECIVMEYVDGVTLQKAKDFPRDTRRRLAVDLADTMSYVHKCQIVHRDLKPENIFITHNGQHVKIIDFGFADSDMHVALKQPAGTPKYMSKEQNVSDEPDVRNDVYSLGCVLKEMDLGWAYGRCISRMLKPIDKRTASMEEVKADLESARGLPQKMRMAGFVGLMALVAPVFVMVNQKPQEHERDAFVPEPQTKAEPIPSSNRSTSASESEIAALRGQVNELILENKGLKAANAQTQRLVDEQQAIERARKEHQELFERYKKETAEWGRKRIAETGFKGTSDKTMPRDEKLKQVEIFKKLSDELDERCARYNTEMTYDEVLKIKFEASSLFMK